MGDGSIEHSDLVAEAWTKPLAEFDVANPVLFRTDSFWPYFERLRKEDPIHYCAHGEFGPYWSITRYHDIMAIDTNHQVFSSDAHLGGITLRDMDDDFVMPMFIAMDQPKHDAQRKVVTPIVSPDNLARMEGTIRERICKTLDELPRGEVFDWVDLVSIELTTQMLATLFDFPWEDRRKLTRWSDIATASAGSPIYTTEEARQAELLECVQYFMGLWNERINAPPQPDLISMLAHGEATRNMDKMEFLGNLILLIVGGNDTTRNSMSGTIYAFNQFPDQWAKLKANPELVHPAVSEIIRWQTPLAYMRRTALADHEIGGKTIRKGDRVAMWYVSGNRDEDVIENPDVLNIERPRPRQHLSFGFGIHRCVGNRLAELQLKILLEEMLKRFDRIEVIGEPERVHSSFVKGYASMQVRIPA